MKKDKKLNERLEYNLNNFFVKKLSFLDNKLYFANNITISELALFLKLNLKNLQKEFRIRDSKKFLHDDKIAEILIKNQIDFEKVEEINETNIVNKLSSLISKKNWNEEAVDTETRPPIITIMGHVDHGKTTLLDSIRKSNLSKKEVGGITQKIGAYKITHNKKEITFIDTPGHEAFTEMRAKGSKVTDIAIILVAADDSLMNQTKESIDHAKAANVPIVVVINKIDAPGANVTKVKKDLLEYGIISEENNGDVPIVEVSALKGKGIDNLLEILLLKAELLELKSPYNILPTGTVIETHVDKNRGNLVSVIVDHGTLKEGDEIIIDNFIGKIKAIHDDLGNRIKHAYPGTPVELYGLGGSPASGSKFLVFKNKNQANKIVASIKEYRSKNKSKTTLSFDQLFSNFNSDKKKFNIVLKANSIGMLNAINSKVEKFSNEEIEVKIIRKEVGEVTNTDISLAEASKAHIYTFNTKVTDSLKKIAKSKNILINDYDVIYKLFEDIETKISLMKEDKFIEEKIGEIQILKVFYFSKLGNIAGCSVKKGIVKNNSIAHIYRGKDLIFNGKINSLKIENKEVKEARAGQECGITFQDFDLFKEEDIIEVYEVKKVE